MTHVRHMCHVKSHDTTSCDKWKLAKSKGDIILLGDTNLDFCKWDLPEHNHTAMVDMIKNEIEVEGFAQLVTGCTIFWPGQTSSLLDQCWTNCHNRIVICNNISHASSDHKRLRNKCTVLVRKDKSDKFNNIYRDIDDNDDTKELFKITKSKLGWKSGRTLDNFVIDGKSISSPKILASIQLEYFRSKVQKLMISLPPVSDDPYRFLIRALSKWRH